MFYVFQNPGVIDPRSITTFGVSSKVGNRPIGFFGTGLKYAIAVLLRNGCNIVIYSGGTRYSFGTKKTQVRVNEFDIITMATNDGEPVELGFTTELGKTWEMWQAFRELACNALDENGSYFCTKSMPEFSTGNTYVVVTGRAFDSAWADKDDVILSSAPVTTYREVAVHAGESEWVYYRGVRAYKTNRKSRFTYNIHRAMELTEDRTFKHGYVADHRVSFAIMDLTDRSVLEEILTAPDTAYEYHLPYGVLTWGPTFATVAYDLAKKFHPRLHPDVGSKARKNRFDEFVMDETLRLDEMDKLRLEKAVEFCHAIGYPVRDYPIIVSGSLPDNVLGMATNEKIYINRRTFLQGTKMVAGTLIEEYIHLKHKVSDNTSQMQNLLIDSICSLGERLTRTPL
jgi:hypothetical protein